MKRRAFLKFGLAASGLLLPTRLLRGQAFTFYDPQIYAGKKITPSGYSVAYWWKASSITGIANGAGIPTWTSVDGSATALNVLGGSTQPTYVASSTFNGQPGVSFNYSYFDSTPVPIVIPANFTACILAYTSQDAMILTSLVTNTQFRKYRASANVISAYANAVPEGVSSTFSTPTTSPVCNWWQRDTGGNMNFFENATARGSQAGFPAMGFCFEVGANINSASYMVGVMTELVIWNGVLTPTQIAAMYTGYFQPLYGV